MSRKEETEKEQKRLVVEGEILERRCDRMVRYLVLTESLQKVHVGAKNLRVAEHPESDCAINHRCNFHQLKGLSVQSLIEQRRLTVGIGH